MNISKTKYIFASLLAALSLLTPTSVIYADSNNSLTYKGDTNKLIVKEDNDYFDSMKEMLPGGKANETFSITNNSDATVTYYIYAEVPNKLEEVRNGKSLKPDLIDKAQLKLTVDGESKPFYEGAVAGNHSSNEDARYLTMEKDDHNIYGIKLCTLDAGKDTSVNIEVSLPSDLDNSYMDSYGQVDWKFCCEVIETSVTPTPVTTPPVTQKPSESAKPSTDVTPAPTTKPAGVIIPGDVTPPDDLPKTGITSQNMIQILGLFGIVAVGLVSMDVIKRRKNNR
ncbi:MAG: LPXTG cell wall anchor domain-containing protein [bacterium]|nr:LPXTG cell wall anchor domain-containing protein [bacterium]